MDSQIYRRRLTAFVEKYRSLYSTQQEFYKINKRVEPERWQSVLAVAKKKEKELLALGKQVEFEGLIDGD